jgi:hypothetical protein
MTHSGRRDPGLEELIAWDGTIMVLDAENHWVKFKVRSVEANAERPHGIAYSLTLHDRSGRRLVGFDNAHPVRTGSGPARKVTIYDHRHRLGIVRPYRYVDARTLLEDFWRDVEAVLRERGVER